MAPNNDLGSRLRKAAQEAEWRIGIANRSRPDLPRYHAAMAEVQAELMRAVSLYTGFRSVHEGAAVILEEWDEFWAEVKAKELDRAALRVEVKHLAAMAIRFMAELTETPEPRHLQHASEDDLGEGA